MVGVLLSELDLLAVVLGYLIADGFVFFQDATRLLSQYLHVAFT